MEDIKLIVYDETVESFDRDTNINPQPPYEVLEENRLLLNSVEVAPENRESSDQEMIELETSGDPAPENPAHPEDVSTKVIAEKTSSTENSTVFVDGGKLNESITGKTEDDHPEISVTNGTTLDGELRNQSTVEDGHYCLELPFKQENTRVAPLKQMTIPRIELTAAVLAVRVDTMLQKKNYSFNWTNPSSGPIAQRCLSTSTTKPNAFKHL
ncbi:uncharacterized protein LOC144600543 [Rhinoraja longicauda]